MTKSKKSISRKAKASKQIRRALNEDATFKKFEDLLDNYAFAIELFQEAKYSEYAEYDVEELAIAEDDARGVLIDYLRGLGL